MLEFQASKDFFEKVILSEATTSTPILLIVKLQGLQPWQRFPFHCESALPCDSLPEREVIMWYQLIS